MPQTEKRALKSHLAHAQHLTKLITEKEQRLFILKNKDCVAYQLNIRTLKILEPILEKKSTWLTIGDYNGFEAQFFKEHQQSTIASDLSDTFLQEAFADKLIEEYRTENVEQLSFGEESMDYVFCRHAFHHFPRAYMGIYEMLRVCKKATILIEPVDVLSKMPLLLLLKNLTDRIHPHLINKIWKNRFSWEKVGNYVFKISEREIEKIAMGIGLPCVAFREINVLLYIKETTTDVPINFKLLNKIKRKIRFLDFFCKIGIIPCNTLCSILFKETPDPAEIIRLKKEGYKIIELPANPYLK